MWALWCTNELWGEHGGWKAKTHCEHWVCGHAAMPLMLRPWDGWEVMRLLPQTLMHAMKMTALNNLDLPDEDGLPCLIVICLMLMTVLACVW